MRIERYTGFHGHLWAWQVVGDGRLYNARSLLHALWIWLSVKLEK